MFVATIFISLLVTLNCPHCPMLNSIQFALQFQEQYIIQGLLHFVLNSLLTHAFMNSFIHSFNVVGIIYVNRSLSVILMKIGSSKDCSGILKLIWNRTSGKNGSQHYGYGIFTRISGKQFVCLNAIDSVA